MKGLAITILLVILEVCAIASGGGDLLSSGPQAMAPIRKEEASLPSEAPAGAERLGLAGLDPAAPAADGV